MGSLSQQNCRQELMWLNNCLNLAYVYLTLRLFTLAVRSRPSFADVLSTMYSYHIDCNGE